MSTYDALYYFSMMPVAGFIIGFTWSVLIHWLHL